MNKAEQDFKEWYLEKYYVQITGKFIEPSGENLYYWHFMKLPIEFRWGVYQKFFKDTTNIRIYHAPILDEYMVIDGDYLIRHKKMKSPQEAIDKAFELLNERKDG